MHKIEHLLLKAISTAPEQSYFIAYSGGIDSQVLLHALVKVRTEHNFAFNITVCHIHHGLSDNADHWLEFARRQSQVFTVNFSYQKVIVATNNGQGIEANARKSRYRALVEMTQAGDTIFTGHHQDDQVETLLLALKRGSGLKGLSGMESKRDLQQRLLVRPLITVTRADIELYAQANNLEWIEDESNQDTHFDRNFLRQQIIPLLKQRWPAITSTINRSAEHCREAEQLMAEIAEQDLALCAAGTTDANIFSITDLASLSSTRFNNVIRYVLSQQKHSMPSSAQLAVLREQLDAEQDKTPQVKVGDVWFRRFNHQLYLTAELNDVSAWCQQVKVTELTAQHPLLVPLPDSLGTIEIATEQQVEKTSESSSRYQALTVNIDSEITFKFIHDNPHCWPDFRQKSRPLKKVLQELAIPPWHRKRLVFIYVNDKFAGVLGYFICKPFIDENLVKTNSDGTLASNYQRLFIRQLKK
ncbi:MAG: tRNA lysidine(34) synthetase TilS [Thalassotalea sp.]